MTVLCPVAPNTLNEIAFLFARLFILCPRRADAFTLRYFGDCDVPPGLVARDAVVIRRFDDNDRSAVVPSLASQCTAQFFMSLRTDGARAEAGGVGGEVHRQQVSVVFFATTIAIIRAQPRVSGAAAQAANA